MRIIWMVLGNVLALIGLGTLFLGLWHVTTHINRTVKEFTHPRPCSLEYIPASAWQAAGAQLGLYVPSLDEGVLAFEGEFFGSDNCLAAPLTSADVLAHGHLSRHADGSITIRRLRGKPVHIDRIDPGETVTIQLR
jgi:hypothetical protein